MVSSHVGISVSAGRWALVLGLAAVGSWCLGCAAAQAEPLPFGNKLSINAAKGEVMVHAPGVVLKANAGQFLFNGPGFETGLEGSELTANINEAKLGLDNAAGPAEPVEVQVIPLAALGGFPFFCGDREYSFASGELVFTDRMTSEEDRPAPYPPGFNAAFPIATLVGTIEGTVVDQDGKTFDVVGLDSAHEVLSDEGFTSVTGVQLNFIDETGAVVDNVGLTGNFNHDGVAAESVIVDTGTCREDVGPGFVFAGPFFVFPFVTDQLITITGF